MMFIAVTTAILYLVLGSFGKALAWAVIVWFIVWLLF